MSDVLVKVEGVSKKFCKTLNRSMLYGMKDIAGNMLGKAPDTGRLRPGEFWSVDDVSFEVRRGECLGLIGPNGAGKSTLLKILNGIISPDKGRVEIRGRVGALIEVTAGFHPMLTGRENIYINGTILGLSKKEIDKKFDEIVEFSELGDFINSPVKNYSSGMNVRLGFAIAAQMEADVLLIDEVLAVGDLGFRIKCLNAMTEISKNSAMIFVSHSIPLVTKICSNICVMDKGRVNFLGNNVPNGIAQYYSSFKIQKGVVSGSGKAKINKIEFESNGSKNVTVIKHMDELFVHLFSTIDPQYKFPTINIAFKDMTLQQFAQINSIHNKFQFDNAGELLHIIIKVPKINFNPGVYSLTISIMDEYRREILAIYDDIKELRVVGDFIGFTPVQMVGEWYIERELRNT